MSKVLFFGFILHWVIAYGQTDNSTTISTALFKVTHPNSSKVSYLFGTHHAFGETFLSQLKNVEQSLLSCDEVIKENLDIPGRLVNDIINRREEMTYWEKYLSKEDHRYVQELFAASETDYNKLTPPEMHAFLTRHYKEKYCEAKSESDSSMTLDNHIGKIGELNGLKLVGLETSEEQIVLINKDVEGMPRKVHKRRLAAVIERLRSETSADCSEIEWYQNMEFDYHFDQPCRNKLTLTDRNDKWMSTIKEELKSTNCFIAVGLSHLMFECGLIRQIRELGYTVEPVCVK